MQLWEVWFADFPYEEDVTIIKSRPVIVLNVEPLEVLCVKVTSHDQRIYDDYDTPITHWKYAGLDKPSVARVSKTIILTKEKFTRKIGTLHDDDKVSISEKYNIFLNS